MGKKAKLAQINEIASNECLENLALLDNLISNSRTCPPGCGTLLEMVRSKTENAFKKIEKSREILGITD